MPLVLSLGEKSSIVVYDIDGNVLKIRAQRIGGRRVPPRVDLVFEDPARNFVISLASGEQST